MNPTTTSLIGAKVLLAEWGRDSIYCSEEDEGRVHTVVGVAYQQQDYKQGDVLRGFRLLLAEPLWGWLIEVGFDGCKLATTEEIEKQERELPRLRAEAEGKGRPVVATN